MAHFAKINGENIVTNIIVAEPETIASGELGDPNDWIQYSYNTFAGKYWELDENERNVVAEDQSKMFRYNAAFINAQWDPDVEPDGAFYEQKHDGHDSWTLNTTTYLWEPPVARPENSWKYEWDEAAYQEDNTQGWVLKEGLTV